MREVMQEISHHFDSRCARYHSAPRKQDFSTVAADLPANVASPQQAGQLEQTLLCENSKHHHPINKQGKGKQAVPKYHSQLNTHSSFPHWSLISGFLARFHVWR